MNIRLGLVCSLLFAVSTAGGALAVSPADQKAADKLMSDYFRLIKAGEEEEALRCIDKALVLSPAPSTYRARAELNVSLNKPQEAFADAQIAKKLEPNNPENTRMVAHVLAAQGKTLEAIKEFDKAIAGDPKNGTFRFERARLLEHNHDYAKAAADYSVTISVAEPQNRARYLEARGGCYMQTKEYKKAIDDFTGALAKSYGRSRLLRNRALAYKALGDGQRSQKDMKDAEAMDETFEPPKTLGVGR